MTAPNLGCLEAPGIVPHASLLAIQIESYGRARSPVRVFGGLCVFAAQVPHCHCAELLLCGFTVYARMGRGGGLLQRHCVVDACVWASNLVGVNVRGGVSERTVSTRFLA